VNMSLTKLFLPLRHMRRCICFITRSLVEFFALWWNLEQQHTRSFVSLYIYRGKHSLIEFWNCSKAASVNLETDCTAYARCQLAWKASLDFYGMTKMAPVTRPQNGLNGAANGSLKGPRSGTLETFSDMIQYMSRGMANVLLRLLENCSLSY
jgi:hypothetical protein